MKNEVDEFEILHIFIIHLRIIFLLTFKTAFISAINLFGWVMLVSIKWEEQLLSPCGLLIGRKKGARTVQFNATSAIQAQYENWKKSKGYCSKHCTYIQVPIHTNGNLNNIPPEEIFMKHIQWKLGFSLSSYPDMPPYM